MRYAESKEGGELTDPVGLSARWLVGSVVALCAMHGLAARADDESGDSGATPTWFYHLYVDAAYADSDNDPANGLWRSKSSKFKLDSAELNLALATFGKAPTAESRWGFELGVQTGVDTEGLVTAPPPPANEPIDHADTWRHLYRANVSYLFGAGRGLRLTAGLINSHIGYESYLALENPNYTNGYLSDLVPYFLIGVEAAWDVSEAVDLNFYLTTGFNYLTNPNDLPSGSVKLSWRTSPQTTVTQNLYYGPDQARTDLAFWRFFSDSSVEWRTDRLLLAAAFDFGTEKQAHLAGQPRYDWSSAAVWIRWQVDDRWSLAFRPEIYLDRDGLMTAARQSISAYTGTVKYEFAPGRHRLVGTLEARYDRSTGEEGGYFTGPDDTLVPGQTVVFAGLLWTFGS